MALPCGRHENVLFSQAVWVERTQHQRQEVPCPELFISWSWANNLLSIGPMTSLGWEPSQGLREGPSEVLWQHRHCHSNRRLYLLSCKEQNNGQLSSTIGSRHWSSLCLRWQTHFHLSSFSLPTQPSGEGSPAGHPGLAFWCENVAQELSVQLLPGPSPTRLRAQGWQQEARRNRRQPGLSCHSPLSERGPGTVAGLLWNTGS